ncbi:zf-HC2 domain-containing protein [Peteryoungia desertarenae]|uniref:zf-HC2 domain-containing protein n=1 Tax=Peteryoungia desertarenae TaxID=1813451 RepID=UPI001AEDC89E|nr:zf-HC2 domain-containing protein [Peteryoungia desertarenae]
MMLKCEEVSRLASESLDRKLGRGEWLKMRLHLMICDGCNRFTRQMSMLRQVSKAYARQPDDIGDDRDS